MARINSYTKITGAPADSDCFIIDSTQGTTGTRIVLWSVLKSVLNDIFAAKSHKHSGTDITSAVANATAAMNDSTGQNIASTYVKDVSLSGNTVTVTKGNSTNSTFNIPAHNDRFTDAAIVAVNDAPVLQFTKADGSKVNIATATASSSGIMAAADKATLDSIKNSQNSVSAIPNATIDSFFTISE